jgi:phage tail-like protein
MASPLQGQHRQLFGRFKFRVDDTSNGLVSAAFQSATGLKYTIAKIEYWEGGALAAFKEPGRVTFDDLVLERGVSYDQGFYEWVLEVVDILSFAPGGGGELSPLFKRNLLVKQLERDNTIVLYYDVRDAFPIEWSPGDFDNTADEVSMDSLTLTYHHFTRHDISGAQI